MSEHHEIAAYLPVFIRKGRHARILLGDISAPQQQLMIDSGQLPPPIELSDRISGWIATDLIEFLRSKAA